jgi:hypothetical protein
MVHNTKLLKHLSGTGTGAGTGADIFPEFITQIYFIAAK